MPLQHYLPATFLAHFSMETSGARRDRVLAAGDKLIGNAFSAKASRLAGENDLYTLTSSQLDPLIVDRSLSGYEANLSTAIDQLIQRDLTTMAWATTLVPFIAGLLVRGPDFNARFDTRITQLGIKTLPDNTNIARLMEFQRLLAPVAAAQWIVLAIQSDDPMITSDIGHAPFANPELHHFGMAVPIGLSHILVVMPTARRTLAIGVGGSWYPTIDYSFSSGQNHVELNRVLATRARRFIFGPDPSIINSYLRYHGNAPPLEPAQMGFIDGFYAMLHDLDWHRLISALGIPPKSDGQYIYIDLLSDPRGNQSA
jgi:hypothetical protein